MEFPGLLQDFLVLFLLASAGLWFFYRLRLPSITGFLLVGLLAGPYGEGWVHDPKAVRHLADIGVVLLLFTVGAEFSMRRLVAMRRQALGGGLLQVGLTTGLTMAIAVLVGGARWQEALILGFLLSLSSTAIVMRLLSSRGETAGPVGRAALGMLIFQDLCVVPMMLTLSVLDGSTEASWRTMAVSLLLLAGFLTAARLLIPRLLAEAAKTRSHELFVFTVGAIVLGTAWLSAQAGLSLALGAFVAGVVVADNEYSHQVLTEVIPFRESFLGLFFVSVGMLVHPAVVLERFSAVLLWLLLAMAGKMAVIFAVSLLLRYAWPVALRTAFSLAQIGEFSFVLAGVAAGSGLISEDRYQILVAVAVLSMVVSPFWMALGEWLSRRFAFARLPNRLFGGESEVQVRRAAADMQDHVIIVGFGLNGRRLAASLRTAGVRAVALEIDPGRMRRDASPVPLVFGDAASPEVLDAAGVERALALVVAVSDIQSTQRILQAARTLAPDLPVIVRTRHLQDVADLYRLGAREVVVEEVEASLEILLHLLAIAGLDDKTIRSVIRPYVKHPLRHPARRRQTVPRRDAPDEEAADVPPPPATEERRADG